MSARKHRRLYALVCLLMVALVAKHGVEYLFATVVLMGILQILAGVLHLGKIPNFGAKLELELSTPVQKGLR